MAAYGIGDACYIIEEQTVKRGRVSSKKGDTYFVQFVGTCGALQIKEEDMYPTQELAEESMKTRETSRPSVKYL